MSHLYRWPVSQGVPQDSPRLFRGLLFGFLRGSLKALSKAPQLLNVISRQNHIWPVEREEYPEKRAIISAQSRFRLDADVDWIQFSAGCRRWLDAATRDSQPALAPTSTNRETCGLIAVPARAPSHLPAVILGSFHVRLLLSRRFAEGRGREAPSGQAAAAATRFSHTP